MLFHDDRDSNYVLTWKDGAARWHQRAARKDDLDLSCAPPGVSTYITRNGFAGHRRRESCCRQINALMFDLDCHEGDFEESVPRVMDVIDSAIAKDLIPSPNLYVDTGRGLQLYWVLSRSISLKTSEGDSNDRALDYYRDVEAGLAATFASLLEGLGCVTFDTSVFDLSRVGRVPGTYNPLAKRVCHLLSSHEDYYTLDVLKRYASPTGNVDRHPKPSRRKVKVQPFLRRRLKGIQDLQRHRGFDCRGSRENMCFLMYNTATQIHGPERALEMTMAFNSRFLYPLPPDDIRQIAKTVDSVTIQYGPHRGERGYYPLQAATVMDKLFMTSEEVRAIGFFGTKRQEDRAIAKRENAAKRSRRNERVVHLFKMGMTQEHIARKLGCSRRTVASALREAGVGSADRYTLEDKFSLVIAARNECAEKRHTSWLCCSDTSPTGSLRSFTGSCPFLSPPPPPFVFGSYWCSCLTSFVFPSHVAREHFPILAIGKD